MSTLCSGRRVRLALANPKDGWWRQQPWRNAAPIEPLGLPFDSAQGPPIGSVVERSRNQEPKRRSSLKTPTNIVYIYKAGFTKPWSVSPPTTISRQIVLAGVPTSQGIMPRQLCVGLALRLRSGTALRLGGLAEPKPRDRPPISAFGKTHFITRLISQISNPTSHISKNQKRDCTRCSPFSYL